MIQRALVLVLLLAGCQKPAPSPEPASAPAAPEPTATAAEPTQAAAPEPGTPADPAAPAPSASASAGQGRKAGMPNPSSVNCRDKGGKEETLSDAEGNEHGVCVFPDGSRCSSWAFFRGECSPGTCKNKDGVCK